MVIKITVVTEVVIMTSFSKKHLNTLTTDQLSGQLFATLAMFYRVLGTWDSVQISQFLFACLCACPSPPKRLCDFIINEIKEDGMME